MGGRGGGQIPDLRKIQKYGQTPAEMTKIKICQTTAGPAGQDCKLFWDPVQKIYLLSNFARQSLEGWKVGGRGDGGGARGDWGLKQAKTLTNRKSTLFQKGLSVSITI